MFKPTHSSTCRLAICAAFFLGSQFLSLSAQAQDDLDETGEGEGLDDEDFDDEGLDDEGLDDEGLDDELDGEEPLSEEEESSEPSPEELERAEKRKEKGKTQLLVGLRYRALITPKFLMNMFGIDGGATLFVNGIGPEIGAYWGARDDGFMVTFSPWIAYYSMDQTPVKAKTDGDIAWEIVESDLKVWYLTVDAMWDHKIMNRFSFQVGGGFGLGIIGGELRRQEAYQTGAPADGDVPDLALCTPPIAPGLPGTPGLPGECPADGNYDITGNTSTDAWPVYPWINFQLGLRYQPIDEFIGRFEMGVGTAGIWFGLGADYSYFL